MTLVRHSLVSRFFKNRSRKISTEEESSKDLLYPRKISTLDMALVARFAIYKYYGKQGHYKKLLCSDGHTGLQSNISL